MHSADFPADLDVQGKRVALIGGGSSGIQILPQIQRQAKVVHHYMKGKTWIPPAGIGGEGLAEQGGNRKNFQSPLFLFAIPCYPSTNHLPMMQHLLRLKISNASRTQKHTDNTAATWRIC